jgi:flagellar motor protein MotB
MNARDRLRPALPLLLLCACLPKSSNLEEQLDREVRALQIRTRALEAQLQTCATDQGGGLIYPELLQVFAGTEVQVEREAGRAVLVVPADLVFAPGTETLRDEGTMVLDLLGTALQLHPALEVWVVGHNDDALTAAARKRYADPMGISLARARAFAAALTERFGVDAERFTVAGRGEADPVADNDTPQGRAQNRRIVVVIGPQEKYR